MVVPHNIRLHSRFAAKCEFYPLVTTSFTLSLAHILLSGANAMSAVGGEGGRGSKKRGGGVEEGGGVACCLMGLREQKIKTKKKGRNENLL